METEKEEYAVLMAELASFAVKKARESLIAASCAEKQGNRKEGERLRLLAFGLLSAIG